MTNENNAKERNLRFFQDNLNDFLANPLYKHKFVVVHNEEVKGTYDTFSVALEYAVANYPQDEFVVQQVLNEDEQINFLKSAV